MQRPRPIDLICCHGTKGEVTPIRIRVRDEDGQYQDLYLALQTLPPKERSAITLFYLNGYSIKEIASITDTSEDAVKKQLSRGRERLRERLNINH